MSVRRLALRLALVTFALVGSNAFAQAPLGDAKLKALEASIDRALAAYNRQDAKAFYAEFTSAMALPPDAADRRFHDGYDGQIKEFGKYVSRKIIKDDSVLEGETPLFVYEAKFTNTPRVKVSVYFTKDGSASKIINIALDKM